VGHRNSLVAVWGGLRGGVALALALALPEELGDGLRDQIIAMTAGVVLATLLVNATTISLVVHYLGLDEPSRSDEYLGAIGRLLAVLGARERLQKLGFEDDVVEAHLNVAEIDAQDQLERSHLTEAQEVEVLTLRGLHIEREEYQSLSDAGLLPPIATRSLLQEIDDEIEEVELGQLRVDAARRAHLPWYGRLHRWVLGVLPEPLGEDLTAVAYIEVSARRLAAHKAAEELDLFRTLPNIDAARVNHARNTFMHWEQSAASRLEELAQQTEIDRHMLHRRQSQALSRIAAVEVLQDLVAAGVLSAAVAEQAGARVSAEIYQAGS
jgi:CPA1 family monovalent cation:H+ antiporter